MTVIVYVVDLPEFASVVEGAMATPGCEVIRLGNGYWKIEAVRELRFKRKQLGLGPALWNSALSGGFRGRIEKYDRDEMSIVSEQEDRNR
jgi:hypothetical protein